MIFVATPTNVSSRSSYEKEAIQEFTYLFSSSSIVWNYVENQSFAREQMRMPNEL